MNPLNRFFYQHREIILSLLLGLTFSAAVLLIKPTGIGNLYLPSVLIPAVILGMHYRSRLTSTFRIAFDGFITALVLLFCLRIFQAIMLLIVAPPEWDFQVFWVSGSVAARGLNFYVPNNFHEVASTLNVEFSSDFSREILDAGFWYPPLTMFLFLPLGWFDIHMAALVWAVSLCIVLVVNVLLLWNLFLKDMGKRGLVFALLITLLFPPIINNIWFAQINFITLMMFLLFWRDREIGRAGVWLAIGIIVKPFMAILFLFLVFKRQWKACVNTISTLVVISLLSIIAFGITTFKSFLNNPVVQTPPLYYLELGQANLYAAIWRMAFHYLDENPGRLVDLIFISVSIVLLLCTFWVACKLTPPNDEWRLSIIISLGLLIYPNTSTNYYSVLMPLILLLWIRREMCPGGVWSIAIFIGLEALLFGYHGGWSNLALLGSVLFWVAPIAFGYWLIRNKGGTSMLLESF